MNPMTRLLTKGCLMLVGTLAASLSALAVTNDESAEYLKLKNFAVPIYPESAKLEGVTTGIVTAIIAHDSAGNPTDVLVLDSTNAKFTESVRDAVGQWKFLPEANVGITHAPVVRFYFTTHGVFLIQAPGMRSPMTGTMAADTVKFPTFGSLDAAPKALAQPMPVFPQALRGNVAGGTATVAFYVDEKGNARAPIVTEATNPEFAEAARTAVAQWRYETPLQNGRPVVAMQNWTFRFGG